MDILHLTVTRRFTTSQPVQLKQGETSHINKETCTHTATSNSPDEVKEGVGRVELGGGPVSLELAGVSSYPGLDADGQHDAQDDREEGGGGEVSDGSQSHPAARLGVQTRDAGDEGGQDDGQDEHLQHPHQHLARELQVHELTLAEDVAVAGDESDGCAHDDGDEEQEEEEVFPGVVQAFLAHAFEFFHAVQLLFGHVDVHVGVDFVRVLLGRSDGGAGRGVGGRGGHDAGRGFAIPVVNKMEIFEVRFSLDTILSLPLDTEIPVGFGYDTILQFPSGAHWPTYFHNRTRR